MADTKVRIRCICPDPQTHADGDVITLPETLGFKQLAIATKAVRWLKTRRPNASVAEYLGELTEIYLLYCLGSWTLQAATGPKGKLEPIELTPDNVELYLLPHSTIALEIADVADSLYQDAVLSPLVATAASYSLDGPISEPTSPMNGSKSQRRRSPSSISTIPMASTGATD